MKFNEVESGLYLLSSCNKITSKKVSAYSYLNSVKANKSNFTKSQLKKLDIVREFRKRILYLGYRKYFHLLEKQYFRNCPLMADDSKRALHIYGPYVGSFKGGRVGVVTCILKT